MIKRISPRPVQFLALIAAFALLGAPAQPARETITWKPISNAVLKIDERPVKLWEIYLTDKKKHWALLQLGSRFLLLDAEARQIFELSPQGLERRGSELRWQADLQAATTVPTRENGQRQLLASEDWTDKHAGRARILRLRLSSEGRRLEVQLPATPDLRKFY